MAPDMNKDLNILVTYLREHIAQDFLVNYGIRDPAWVNTVVDAWMNDQTNSTWRYDEIRRVIGVREASRCRILDMACGCGTFVYYGLMHDFDVWGLDLEEWKLIFNRMKGDVYGYPESWRGRFVQGKGEHLPFSDCSFDVVASYQTLEHVQDVGRCLSEMLRVLRPGGRIFLRAPDYAGTFESHYCLPWLPFFPRSLARKYLGFLGRPVKGLDDINYVTVATIHELVGAGHASIVDLEENRRFHALRRTGRYFSCLFRKEWPLSLLITKSGC